MGSPSAIITLGLGAWGSPSEVVTLGLGAGSGGVVQAGPVVGTWQRIAIIEASNQRHELAARNERLKLEARK